MKPRFNGKRLENARRYRSLTVAKLAECVDCKRQTLSMYELSKNQPDESTVKRIAKELNFPIGYFYEHPKKYVSGTVYFRSLLTTNKNYRKE